MLTQSSQTHKSKYYSLDPYYSATDEAIDLSESQVNPKDINRVIEFIKQHPKTRYLTITFNFDNADFTDEDLTSLANTIVSLNDLTSLTLISPHDKFLSALEAATTSHPLSSLITLTIERAPSSLLHPNFYTTIMAQIVERAPNLQCLKFENSFLQPNKLESLTDKFIALKQLKHVSLTSYNMSEKNLNNLIYAIKDKNIETLKLKSILNSDPLIRKNALPLTTLHVIIDPIKACEKILNLIETPELMRDLSIISNSTITNYICNKIASFLQLESLYLKGALQNTFPYACQAISKLNNLTSLSISGCSKASFMEELMQSIKHKSQLTSLELSGPYGIDNACCLILATYLPQFTNLKSLSIDGEYTDQELIAIITALRQCSSLQTINITNNKSDSLSVNESSLLELAKLINDTDIRKANIDVYGRGLNEITCSALASSISEKIEKSTFTVGSAALGERKFTALNNKTPCENASIARKHGIRVNIPSLLTQCTLFIRNELRKDECQLKVGRGPDQVLVNADNIADIVPADLLKRLQGN